MPTVRCPACRSSIRLPAGRGGARLRCPRCGAALRPGAGTAGSRRPPARPQSGFRGVLLALLLAAGGGGAIWALWASFRDVATPTPPRAAAAPRASQEATRTPEPELPAADRHPALDRIRYLARAAASANQPVLLRQLHLPAWYEEEAGPDATRWTALPSARRRSYEEELGRRLTGDPVLHALAGAALPEVRYAGDGDPEAGAAVLEMPHPLAAGHGLRFRAVLVDGDWRIAGIEDVPPPPPPEPEPSAREKALEKHYVVLEDLEEAPGEAVAGEDGGPARTYRGTIARVAPVPGTAPEEVRHLESLVGRALNGPGPDARAAERQLMAAGHKAIPFLLNRIVALPLTDDPERVLQLAALDGLLRRISYRREATAFPVPGLTNIEDPVRLRRLRQVVLEAWFGWWERWGGRWEAWSREAEIPPPDPRRRRP